MDFAAFSRLRPMMPVAALIEAAGSAWEPPTEESEGRVWFKNDLYSFFCIARIDQEGRIGSLGFYKAFPAEHPVEGLVPGMTLEAARLALGPWQPVHDPDAQVPGVEVHAASTPAGDRIEARFKDGILVGFEIERPGLQYPERPYRYADPGLTTAFDLYCGGQRTLPENGRDSASATSAWRNGWCFGRPPGIAAEQWPLCPASGQPMRHAFTLLLPEQYRTQGEDFPVVSLFVGPMHFERDELSAAVTEISPHPRKFAMNDIIDTHFVALWLSREEFDGPLAALPQVASDMTTPDWMEAPYEAYGDLSGFGRPTNRDGKPYDWLPGRGLETAFPIGVIPREDDPNTGRPARERDTENEDSGYVPAFSEQGQALELERFHGALAHLGGTLFPQQGYPPFSARVLEFEENFAGFNFGVGTAQLDLEQMKIDWACG